MLYKFKSKVTGDTLMLAPTGDQMLRLLGREPAAQGIIEPAAMVAAMATLQAAVEADDAVRASPAQAGDSARDAVSLRSRLWPMIDMLKRAQAAGEPVVWGV